MIHPCASPARGCVIVWSMTHKNSGILSLLLALLALIIFTPARAQIAFSDSVRIGLLTCSSGPDAYERFGHAGIRVQDLKKADLDITFHYGVFSFHTPNFVYRFVKGETDYQLGAIYTSDFINDYRRRGLGMTQQWLRLDSAQMQDMIERLLINYRPENRTYRYSYFFDNCSTRPYRLLQAVTDNSIKYDSTWVNAITLRQMVQQCTGTDNWLDFGIALAVAGRSDIPTLYEEQLFLPDYLAGAVDHAEIPARLGDQIWYQPLVTEKDTLLTMRPDIEAAITAPDSLKPAMVFAFVLVLALIISLRQYLDKKAQRQGKPGSKVLSTSAHVFDTVFFLFLGITGLIVWFLNFISEHPAVDHNLNCFWLLPTHVIMAVLLWYKKLNRVCQIYFGITFAAVILYVILDWTLGQYCPAPFLLLLATILLRCYSICITSSKQ